jgi:hypothetical protein
MITVKRIGVIAVFLILSAGVVFAQNTLTENKNYRQSLDLKRAADAAFAEGDFQGSIEKAQESERLAVVARSEAEKEYQRWVAYNLKNRAFMRISFGERVNAAERIPDTWMAAKAAYALATETFNAASYLESADASRQVIALLEGLREEKKIVEPKREPK